MRPSAYLSDTSRHTVMLVKKTVIVASTPQSSAPAAGAAGRYLHFHERVTAISGKRAGLDRKEGARHSLLLSSVDQKYCGVTPVGYFSDGGPTPLDVL